MERTVFGGHHANRGAIGSGDSERTRLELIAGKSLLGYRDGGTCGSLQGGGGHDAAIAWGQVDVIHGGGEGDPNRGVGLDVGEHQTSVVGNVLGHIVDHDTLNLISGVRGDGHHGVAAGGNLCASEQLGRAVFSGGNVHGEGVAHQLILPHPFHHSIVHAEVTIVDSDGQGMVSVGCGIGHVDGPHPGRYLAVGAQTGGVQLGGGDLFTVQGEGERTIDSGVVGLSHGGDAGIQLHAGTVEVEGVGGAVLVGAGEAQVLILGVLDVLHPTVGLVGIHIEAVVGGVHVFAGDCTGLIGEVVLCAGICVALIHIHLHGISLLAIALHHLSGEQAGVGDLGSVNTGLVVVDFLNGQCVDTLLQTVKHQALVVCGAGFPLCTVNTVVGDGGSDVLGLVGTQKQLHLGAVEGKGGLSAVPVGEVAVVLQGILLHSRAIGLGLTIGPLIIIGEAEQAGTHGVVVDGDGGALLIVRSGKGQLHIVDSGQLLGLDSQTNGRGGLSGVADAAPHALVFRQLAQFMPLAIGTQIGSGHGLDGVTLFHHGDLTQQAGIKGVFQGIALALLLLGLPIGLRMSVEGKGGVSTFALRAGLGGGIGGPEVQVGLAAAQGNGEAAVIIQGDFLQLTVVVLVHLIEGVTCGNKAGVSGDGDLLAGVVRRAGLPLRNVELVVPLGSTSHQAVHDHECLGGGGTGKVLFDFALVQAGEGIEVAQYHVAGLAVVGVGEAGHGDVRQTELLVFGFALSGVEVATSEASGGGGAFVTHLADLEHDPVVVQTGELVVNGVDTVDDLAPLQQTTGGGSVLIPQVGAVELVLHTEEVQPFHAGQDGGIDDQVLVGLGVIEGKGIQVLAEHNGLCTRAVHAAIGQHTVPVPSGEVEQLAGCIFLYGGVRQVDAGGVGPAVVSVVIVPGEQIRLSNADIFSQICLSPLVGVLVGVENDPGIVLAGPLKPFAEGLCFGGGVTTLVTEAEADGVVDIGFHGVRDEVPGLASAAHVVAAEGSLGNAPDGVGVVEHIVGVFKIRIIEQGAVIAELLCLLHGGGASAISAAGRPTQHGQAPLHHSGLTTGQVLVAIFVLIGDAAALRGGLLLGHCAGVGEDHKLIHTQFTFRALPVGDLEADVPGLIGHAKLIAGHILVILHAGVHVALGDGGFPVGAVGTHRNPSLVGAQCQIGGAKGGTNAADTVRCTQIHGEQGDGLVVTGAVGELTARHAPVALVGVDIAAVVGLALRQHHGIVLFQNLQKGIFIVKIGINGESLFDGLVIDCGDTSTVVGLHLGDLNIVCGGVLAVGDSHIQVVSAGFGHIHGHIALGIQVLPVHRHLSGVRLGKGIDLDGVHRHVSCGGVIGDLGGKTDVVGLDALRVITHSFQFVDFVQNQIAQHGPLTLCAGQQG